MTTTVAIEGTCDQRFLKVKEAFAENFAAEGEVGAGVALYVEGRPVVELWGGHADAARGRPWTRDTIVNVYSTTKGMTAICAHRLVEEGKLDIDAPVARYWPEFGRAGKGEIPVRWLLSHRAGMAAIRRPVTREQIYDWDFVTACLAEQEPFWEPGTAHGYHAVTFGWLVGEVVRRVTGKSLGTYFRETFAQPLGLDFHIGTGAEHDSRTAELIAAPPPPPDQPNPLALMMADPESVSAKAFGNPPVGAEAVNTRAWRAAEIPAANGHGRAPALARIYGAIAAGGDLDGVHVLGPAQAAAAIVEQSSGPDKVLTRPTRFGLGFMLTSDFTPLGPNPRAFGHPGAGGSLGYADLDAGIGFGYVMNQMQSNIAGDPRVKRLIDAAYASL
jgi:CubicO group peptidase (beta-lactamase class C family)